MHTGLILPFGLLMQLGFNKPQSQAPSLFLALSSLLLYSSFLYLKLICSIIPNVILKVACSEIEMNFILDRLFILVVT